VNPRKILLVDDEPSIRFLLTTVLEQAGYRVEAAEDGYAALRKIQQALPDLVITDLRMPNMNGFELLSVLRTRFPKLPTIAISGEFLTVDAQQGPLADAFFQKGNYALPDFLAKISQLLEAPRLPKTSEKPEMWTPTGDAPVMLTCMKCLRSFPIDPCEGSTSTRMTDCIFCGVQLEVQLIAVGMATNAS
jgi:CheY-like chemotaxis protein